MIVAATLGGWYAAERDSGTATGFIFVAVFLALISVGLLFDSGVGKVGNSGIIDEDTFYQVVSRIELPEESTILILEEGDGNFICVEVSDPPPEDAIYVKRQEETETTTTTRWVSSGPDKKKK